MLMWKRLLGPFARAPPDQRRERRGSVFRHRLDQCLLDAADQPRPFEHESGIELDQRRPGLDLGERRLAGIDAADADQRQLALRDLIDAREHARRAGE